MTRRKTPLSAWVLGVLALAGLTAGGPVARAAVVERIAARVNGEVILESEVQEAMQPLVAAAAGRLDDARLEREIVKIRSQVLDLLIDEELMIQQARTEKLTVLPEELESAQQDLMARNKMATRAELEQALAGEGRSLESFHRDIERQLLVMQVRTRQLARQMRVSDSEISAYYEEHAAEFAVPERVALGLIVLPLAGGAEAAAEARRQAAGLVADLRAGSRDFAQTARELSVDPSGMTGGDLGWLTRGSMRSELEEAAFAMAAGDLSEPLEVDGRLHILRVDRREAGSQVPLEQARRQIRNTLLREREDRASRRWLDELRSKAFIEKKYD